MSVDMPEFSLFDSALSDIQELDFENQDGASLFPKGGGGDESEDGSEYLNNNLTLKQSDNSFLIRDENLKRYLNIIKERSGFDSDCLDVERKQSTSANIRLFPSHTHCEQSEEFEEGGLSMSKNAITARENRQKKKKYINGLEQSVKQLSGENHQLKCKVKKLRSSVCSLEEEIKYLKGVIANQSTLSMLLKNIKSTPGVEFSSSLNVKSDDIKCRMSKVSAGKCQQKRGVKRVASTPETDSDSSSSGEESSQKLKLDHDYASSASILSQKRMKNSQAGVCLHVSNKSVSLEFCSLCNFNATVESKKPTPS